MEKVWDNSMFLALLWQPWNKTFHYQLWRTKSLEEWSMELFQVSFRTWQ